jgi:hypothetical protein
MRRFTIRRFKVRHFVVHYLTFQNWSFENLSYPLSDPSLSGSLDALLEAEPLLALRPIADHLPGHRREGFRLFQILKKKISFSIVSDCRLSVSVSVSVSISIIDFGLSIDFATNVTFNLPMTRQYNVSSI